MIARCPRGLKGLVGIILRHYGGGVLAAKAMGISRQRLEYYRDTPSKTQELIEALEKARIDMKLSKSAFWDLLSR